jgi:hypothetical protein
MTSRRKLLLGVVCFAAVGAVFAAAAKTTAAPPAGASSAESAGATSRMRAAAGRDLFAVKTWRIAPPPPPPPKPIAPPFPYVYSGSMRDAGEAANAGPVLLFIKAGNRNFIVRKGETVGAAYRLDDITEREAVFTYLPLQQKQSLAIGNTQ